MATEQTQTQVCYRHPRTETAVACSSCGRPICTECMVFAAVGIKCPECAGQPTGAARTATRARTGAAEGGGYVVTKIFIGINIAVFLAQGLQTGSFGNTGGGELFQRGALYGPLVADGEWWRLVTSGFLHGGLIHIFFNSIMLWWFGRPLELLLGRGRFVGIYLVSLLAGSAGALLVRPDVPTIGASGAVFGILGAGLVLERKQIAVFGGAAAAVVVLNLALSFMLPNISIGGHIGGLAGGALAILAMSGFGRRHAVYGRLGLVGFASLLGVAVVSVTIAYLRVRGYA
jgi:membrane associated rhomboid family serine protease